MFKNLCPGAVGIKAGFEEAVKLAKDNGFHGLDLYLDAAKQMGAGKIQETYAQAGLKMGTGVPCPEFRKDEETFKKGLATLPESAKLAVACGCTRCATWIMPASDELPFAENFKQHAQRLREVAKILNDYGITFGLEFVGPATIRKTRKYEFIWNLPGMLELCDAIGTPNMGLLVDSFHWYTSRGTVEDLTRLKAKQVVLVHVNDAPKGVAVEDQVDNQRALPGETGTIDIGTFLRALDKIGCDAPVTSEPFSKTLPALPAAEVARVTAGNLNAIWKTAGLK
ncbi:MAG: sugar phosphate isomerase/epimerase [Planctomycetes bacterium]|nr:sugar phosphate isomerase/epimerase [Planctomycetota bacterium]